MFVVANPLVPLLALVNNLIEIRVDASKLCYLTQRPQPRSASGIGAECCVTACLPSPRRVRGAALFASASHYSLAPVLYSTHTPILMLTRTRTPYSFRRFLAADLAVHGDARCGDQLCDHQLHKTRHWAGAVGVHCQLPDKV